MENSFVLNQSFAWWCFAGKGVEDRKLLQESAKLGFQGVDFLGDSLWPVAAEYGLKICAVNGHDGIDSGLNRPENADRILDELRRRLDQAVAWKIPVLICFAGSREGVDDETGLQQCAATLSRIAGEAEDAGVTLAVELLNSKVDHPGYQCDRSAWGVRLCKAVDSPSVKLLYDVYHMQIMEGDLLRNIREHAPYIAHYHTAGNPGRGLPDGNQEINYAAVYRAIANTGFCGYIGHEFLPGALPPLEALAKAFTSALSCSSHPND